MRYYDGWVTGGDNMKLVLRLIMCLTILEILKEYVDDEIIQFFNIRQNSIWENLMYDGGAYLIIILLVWVLLNEKKLLKKLKESEERYYYLANHDGLTGLPNRMQFFERLEQALKENHIENNTAILLIDLDGFKNVNDNLGHDAGDLLLQEVSIRLKSCIRETDTVARLAGDEFIVLLPFISREDAAIQVAEKILQVSQRCYTIQNSEVKVTPSIGIAFSENVKNEAETLIKYADMAMYQAKKQGKNNYQIYKAVLEI
jgi:diguanylate cyclase (GGDEF)-like protein